MIKQRCVADHPQTVQVDEQLQVRPAINTQQEVFHPVFRDYFVQPTQDLQIQHYIDHHRTVNFVLSDFRHTVLQELQTSIVNNLHPTVQHCKLVVVQYRIDIGINEIYGHAGISI